MVLSANKIAGIGKNPIGIQRKKRNSQYVSGSPLYIHKQNSTYLLSIYKHVKYILISIYINHDITTV